jgi:hypothetical protein
MTVKEGPNFTYLVLNSGRRSSGYVTRRHTQNNGTEKERENDSGR